MRFLNLVSCLRIKLILRILEMRIGVLPRSVTVQSEWTMSINADQSFALTLRSGPMSRYRQFEER
jgi:hypothetical protein